MNISPEIQRAFGRGLLQIQKHSPVILTAVGVASVVTATVLAAKNTLKLEETVDASQERLLHTREAIANNEKPERSLTATYIRNVASVAKLYVVPATFLVGGVVCILGSQNILHKRNVALVAAYKGLETAYGAYRERVREELGEEKESDIYFGLREEEVVDEKGKKTTVKRTVDGEHSGSPYRFIYDQTNPEWSGHHDMNMFRVIQVQNMYNDILKTRGHVFMSEVLDTLGFERTRASIVTGWVYDPDEKIPNHKGDNCIEFNIRDYQDDSRVRQPMIILDMNVDGTILDLI